MNAHLLYITSMQARNRGQNDDNLHPGVKSTIRGPIVLFDRKPRELPFKKCLVSSWERGRS